VDLPLGPGGTYARIDQDPNPDTDQNVNATADEHANADAN